MGFFNWFLKKPKHIKLGLALGSGGAKGMAHIGVISAFEEAGIDFDIISGTSIGSIVGGLYADGYSPRAMTELVENTDLLDLKKLIVYRLTGFGIEKIVGKALGKLDFSELKKSFAAVAADVDSGKEEIMTDGNLITAMAASSAMPPYFAAVTREGKRLVDGAFLNSVPCDVARALGADFVVGVDLGSRRGSNSEALSVLADFYKDNKIPECDPTEKGYANADIMLNPDLREYRPTSIGERVKMYELGYAFAKERIPEIKEAIERKKRESRGGRKNRK